MENNRNKSNDSLSEENGRVGYKKTKLGWIPKDWKIVRMEHYTFKIGSGSTPRGGEKVYTATGIKFIRSQNVNYNRLILSNVKYIPTHIHKKMKGTIVKANDILLNITGASIGRSCVVPQCFDEGNVNQHVCIIRPKKGLESLYLQSYFSSFNGQKTIFRQQVGGNREGLTKENISSMKIPLPPLLEQQKIVSILSTWDKAINLTHKLIAAKEEQKKGLMQRLLTGKVRLEGFSEDWQEYKFEDVFDFIKSYTFSRSDLSLDNQVTSSEIYNIHYGDIHAKFKNEFIDFQKNKIPFINKTFEVKSKKHFLKNGDIIMADVSEDYKGVGECREMKNLKNQKVIGGLHTFVMRDKRNLTVEGFRVYCMKNSLFRNKLRRLATGSSVFGLSKTNLAKVSLMLPNPEEQMAIASILIKTGEEIQILQQKLAALQAQKKGLMQQLLTGKIRVK